MRLIAIALASTASSCGGTAGVVEPLPVASPSAASPGSVAPDMLVMIGTATPSATPSATLPAVDPSTIHRAWRDLFTAREDVGAYTLVDDVDPHDPSGKRLKTKAELRCAVLAPFMQDGSAHGVFECTGAGGDFSLRYRADARGLFIESDGSIPTFPTNLDEPSPVKFDAGDNTEHIPCIRKREWHGSVLCVETRCKVKVGYGDTIEHLCLDAGVLEYSSLNIGGPRMRRLLRTE